MRSRPRPLLTALRTLAVAAGLMLCLLLSLQFFPGIGRKFGLARLGNARQTEPIQRDELPATDGSESDDPFQTQTLSGSATNGHPHGHASDDSSTFELPDTELADNMVPSPPVDVVTDDETVATGDMLRQLRRRVGDLERRVGAELSRSTSSNSEDRHRIEHLLERLQSQALESKAMIARLDSAERQLKSVEQSVESLHSEGPSPRHPGERIPRISIRSVTDNDEPRLIVKALDASLPELFARLGEASGINILVSPAVAGTISLHLSLPDSDAALDAICRSHGCKMERTGNFVLVTPLHPQAATSAPDKNSQTITKLYRLKHLNGMEVLPLVQGLLTPGVGTVNFPSTRERANRIPDREPPRAILVKDTPAVIVKVDRLLQELDRPVATGLASPGQPLSHESDLVPPRPLPSTIALPISDGEAFEPPVHGTWNPRR